MAAVVASPNMNGAGPRPSNAQDSGVNKRYRPAPAKTFQCRGYGDCRMVFSRSEHLARHIRKHTGERPFSCHCGKQFSRLDNLRQHAQTVHADKQEQNERMMRDLTSLHASMVAANKAGSRGRRGAKKSAQQDSSADGDLDDADDRDADGDADMDEAEPSDLDAVHIKTETATHSMPRGNSRNVRPETSTGYEGMDFNAFRGQDASFRGGSHSFRAFRESARPFLAQANPFKPGQANIPFEANPFGNQQARGTPFEANSVNFKVNSQSRFGGNSVAFETNPATFGTNNPMSFDPSRTHFTPSPPHGMAGVDLGPHPGQQRGQGFSGPGPLDFSQGQDGPLPLGFLPSHLGQPHRQGSHHPSLGQQHPAAFTQAMDAHLRAADGLPHHFSRQLQQGRAYQPYRDLRQRPGPSPRLSLQDNLQIGSQQTGFAHGTGIYSSGEAHPGQQRLAERRSLHLRLSSPRSLGNLQAPRQGVASPFRQSMPSPHQQGAFTSPGHPGITSHHLMGQASPHQGAFPSPGHQQSPFHPSSMGETAHFPFPAFPDQGQDMRGSRPGTGFAGYASRPSTAPTTLYFAGQGLGLGILPAGYGGSDTTGYAAGPASRDDEEGGRFSALAGLDDPSPFSFHPPSDERESISPAGATRKRTFGSPDGPDDDAAGPSQRHSISYEPSDSRPASRRLSLMELCDNEARPGTSGGVRPGTGFAGSFSRPGTSRRVSPGSVGRVSPNSSIRPAARPNTGSFGLSALAINDRERSSISPLTSPPQSVVSPQTASPEITADAPSTSTATAAASPSTSTSHLQEDSRRRHSSANPVMSAYAQDLIRQQQAQMQNVMSKLRDGGSSPTPVSASSAPSPSSVSAPVADLPVRASSSMASTRAATLSRPPARTRASRGRAASAGTADVWEAPFPPLSGPLGMAQDGFYPGMTSERAGRQQPLAQQRAWDELRPLTTEEQYPLPSPQVQQALQSTFEWNQYPPDYPGQTQAAAQFMPGQLDMMPYESSFPPPLPQQPDGPLLPDPQFRLDGRAYGHLQPLPETQMRPEENWMLDPYQQWPRGS
ncbi:hypothetical protein BD626DRAFT_83367 [Schizophyllum amplum]|uniref:C2H2-type domain-containing protein n=1 Tax=Schizophyllum amplum TaxID=97359 RepID=A0A550BS49_9AGAR|nr:hypothetical protein BD626DRAFT_83367 [Auriculariopsis ampla]